MTRGYLYSMDASLVGSVTHTGRGRDESSAGLLTQLIHIL
jgi:hypothetical protein